MHVVRLEQTEGSGDNGEELDIYWLDVVLDEQQRVVETPFLARRSGAMRRVTVPRGTVVAPYWHVRLDVGDTDVALLHWNAMLAELDGGVWKPLFPARAVARVAGAPMVYGNFRFDLRTGALQWVQRGDAFGKPTRADKAQLLAVVKQHMVFRGPEARANPAAERRPTLVVQVDEGREDGGWRNDYLQLYAPDGSNARLTVQSSGNVYAVVFDPAAGISTDVSARSTTAGARCAGSAPGA